MRRFGAFGVALLLGLAIGIGAYTFFYAKGAAYLRDDPAACANCHIMNDHYSAWLKSSHRAVATCNSCHTPHGVIPKYLVKAENGFRHSWKFTTGHFVEPLQITARNREIAESACRTCHQPMVEAIEGPHAQTDGLSCLHCHRGVGHQL